MVNIFFRAYAGTFLFVLTFAAGCFAQTEPTAFPDVKIGNFGRMDERYYRGAQPNPGDYQALKDLGVTTVIDLRNDPTDYEKTEVEALGMKYINLPMSGWKTPKEQQIAEFMRIMDDPSTGTVYVHCKAGKHRTGITGAVYRHKKYGWDYKTSYREMKNYNFTSWPVHFALKEYVEDYFDKVEDEQEEAAKAARKAATAGQVSGN